MRRYDILRMVGWALPAIGAINWGTTGAANFNIVHTLFGRNPSIERSVYVLVGLAGLLSLFQFFGYTRTPSRMER